MSQKRIMNRDHVVRVSWERDGRHKAWLDWNPAAPPTRETHPDAFYVRSTPAYPVPAERETRQAPHRKLSRTQLRKRLARAGLSGAELRRTLAVIHAGPTLQQLAHERANRLAFGWDIRHLADAIGTQLARKLLRFVRTTFIMRDEFWDLARGLGARGHTAQQDVRLLAR
jgi:hypothetical protein